jgi:peptidoglycan/LPS O-acetylase OafA/YrhL
VTLDKEYIEETKFNKKFEKKDTLAIKGIAIILMYIHHLFYSLDYFNSFEIKPLFLSRENLVYFSVGFCKVCVAIFVFLTAYGLTKSYEKLKTERAVFKSTIKRYLNLEIQFSLIVIISITICFMTNVYNPLDIYGRDYLQSFFYFLLDILGIASFWGGVTLNASWWYMTLAITLIFILPVLWKFYNDFKYLGILLLPISVLLPKLLGMYENINNGIIFEATNFSWYFFTVMLGLVTASENLLERLVNYKSLYKHSSAIKLLVGSLMLLIVGYVRMRWGLISITEGIIVFLICFLSFSVSEIKNIKFVKIVLQFLGKYSMNMYLIHSFVFMYIFKDFIYSFKYTVVILIVLIVITLLVAIGIETLKKIIKFQNVIDLLYRKVDKILD